MHNWTNCRLVQCICVQRRGQALTMARQTEETCPSLTVSLCHFLEYDTEYVDGGRLIRLGSTIDL